MIPSPIVRLAYCCIITPAERMPYSDAIRNQRACAVTPPERCPRGRRSTPGKRVWGHTHRGFESPHFRFPRACRQHLPYTGKGLDPMLVIRELGQRSFDYVLHPRDLPHIRYTGAKIITVPVRRLIWQKRAKHPYIRRSHTSILLQGADHLPGRSYPIRFWNPRVFPGQLFNGSWRMLLLSSLTQMRPPHHGLCHHFPILIHVCSTTPYTE